MRCEELELAAKVASRRAAAAEAEVHRLKQQLEAADKRAKELAWQVRGLTCPGYVCRAVRLCTGTVLMPALYWLHQVDG